MASNYSVGEQATTHLTLWRAADATEPHLGYRSFWALSRGFAERFAVWLREPDREKALGERPTTMYRAELDVPNTTVLDLRPVLLESDRVLEHADRYRRDGIRWVIFYEGVFEGTITPQVVYLGDEPVPAEVA